MNCVHDFIVPKISTKAVRFREDLYNLVTTKRLSNMFLKRGETYNWALIANSHVVF